MILLTFFYVLFKLGLIPIKKLHQSTFNYFFYGLSAKTIDVHVSHFLSQKLNDLIYQPAFARLKMAQNEGFYTAIFSSSPNFLVEKIASLFDVDISNSTVYRKDTFNQFSQIDQVMEGEIKAQILRQLIEDLQITKDDVTAYSDSYLDLPFLQMAGNPIAVNPDRRLRALCLKFQWPII